MQPIVVEVVRGDVVEARHAVHAVAVHDGELVAHAGEADLVTFFRSSAKPLQALPLVRARPDLDDAEIAIACASHLARPEQLALVRRLLASAPAGEDELECGPAPTPIEHNCSGKHAGMLALCRAEGWPSPGYRHAGHPCQGTMLAEIADATGVRAETIPTAVDGCGVLTFALSLERMATAFSRLHQLDGGRRAMDAIRAVPDLVRGPSSVDALLMKRLSGWVAKGGAEGLLCAASPDGLGLAVKVADGGHRAVRPALASFLARLGLDPADVGDVGLLDSHGDQVGVLRAR